MNSLDPTRIRDTDALYQEIADCLKQYQKSTGALASYQYKLAETKEQIQLLEKDIDVGIAWDDNLKNERQRSAARSERLYNNEEYRRLQECARHLNDCITREEGWSRGLRYHIQTLQTLLANAQPQAKEPVLPNLNHQGAS